MTNSGGFRSPAPAGSDRTPIGIHIGAGAVLVIVLALAASSIPADQSGWRFALVAGGVSVFAWVTVDLLAAAAVALLGWLVVNGFLVDQLGQLSWHGSADTWRVALLVLAGAVGLVVGAARRRVPDLGADGRPELGPQAPEADIEEKETRGA